MCIIINKITTKNYIVIIFIKLKSNWLSRVLRLHQHSIGYTADGFLQVWWPNQQCQSTGGWLVIQTGLNLTMLTSPCYNTRTCMQILHKKII